jgi:hypothetical protein
VIPHHLEGRLKNGERCMINTTSAQQLLDCLARPLVWVVVNRSRLESIEVPREEITVETINTVDK